MCGLPAALLAWPPSLFRFLLCTGSPWAQALGLGSLPAPPTWPWPAASTGCWGGYRGPRGCRGRRRRAPARRPRSSRARPARARTPAAAEKRQALGGRQEGGRPRRTASGWRGCAVSAGWRGGRPGGREASTHSGSPLRWWRLRVWEVLSALEPVNPRRRRRPGSSPAKPTSPPPGRPFITSPPARRALARHKRRLSHPANDF